MISTRKKYKKKRKSSRKLKTWRYKSRGGNLPSDPKAIIYVLTSSAGFFAVFAFMLRVYLYAKEKKLPFFIENSDWQYTYKDGWHDYFKSLEVFNGQFDVVDRYRHYETTRVPFYKISEMISAIKEVFVLNDDLQKRASDYIQNELNSNYTSLYVRRGDKIDEIPLIPIDKIISQTTIADDGRTIFVQSDDYSVVNDIKGRFPSCKVLSLTQSTATVANNRNLINQSPEQRKAHAEELIVASYITSKAPTGWSYYGSNVGCCIKLLGYENVNLYIDDRYTRENVDKKWGLDIIMSDDRFDK